MAFRHTALAAAFLFATAGLATAQDAAKDNKEKSSQKTASKEATLKVGDKAPELHIAKWVKGEPVTGFEKGKTYVVEFWATWCGPCIASMPHLTHLQKDYKDQVTIIGVTSKDSRGNTLDAVQEMVKQKGAEGMGYTVAWDDERQTNDAYMKASGQGGIPCSFIVDGAGKIAYIGHPMWIDLPLEQITKGTWDPTKGMEKLKGLQAKLQKVNTLKESDPKGALDALAEIERESPAVAAMAAQTKYELLLATDETKARTEGRRIVADAYSRKDAQALNEFAWSMVDPAQKHEKQDLDLALDAAKKGVELTKEKDGAILDTLARVYFIKGDTAKAIELQKKAIANAEGPMKEELEKSLEEYEAKK